MAIYRQIQTTFWTDTKVFDDFTVTDRLLYIYLLTNSHTTLSGCYEISFRQMSYETGLDMDDVEQSIERLKMQHKVISYCEDTKEVLILRWYKYNWTASEKIRKPLLAEINDIKSSAFREYLLCLYNAKESECISPDGYPIDTVSIPYPEEEANEGYPTDTTVTVTNTVTVTDTVSDSVSGTDTVSAKPPKAKTQLEALEETNMPAEVKEKVKEWLKYKAEKRDKYQPTGLKTLFNKIQRNVNEYGASVVMDVIDLSMANGYSGIVWDKIRPSPNQRAIPGSTDDPLARIIRGEA